MRLEEIYQLYIQSAGITTDTRKIAKNQIFFALKGDKFNANNFAEAAIGQGASYAIVDEIENAQNPQCILVDDVLETLQKLANYHRKTFNIPVIGLTGSNGKTTNKELLARVLAMKYKVHATKGNLNNHIGVPLTLLQMPQDTEIAIIEMGANHQREIAMLCRICEPTYGFITNIGKAHLEGFGGIEGVKIGKGELYDFLNLNQGAIFINEIDATLLKMSEDKKLNNVLFYGNDESKLTMLAESPTIKFKVPNNDTVYVSHLGGKYNFENIQTAFAIGNYFGVEEELIAEAIASYNPDNNRSQIVEKGTNSFLMDAYNANPTSMEASVTNFGKLISTKQKVVILGDMFELGEYSKIEHEAIGKLVADQKFDTVVLFGENMKHALLHLPQAFYFTDKFSLHNWLIDKKFENTYFLVKGSRSVGLESILTVI
jgi:UDP-N-acetylmuramoyl-tripeptide--D-alanyl-D-alanine ligase